MTKYSLSHFYTALTPGRKLRGKKKNDPDDFKYKFDTIGSNRSGRSTTQLTDISDSHRSSTTLEGWTRRLSTSRQRSVSSSQLHNCKPSWHSWKQVLELLLPSTLQVSKKSVALWSNRIVLLCRMSTMCVEKAFINVHCEQKVQKKVHCVYHYFVLFTGMVTIKAPNTRVCYQSTPVLKCLFEEVTDSAEWTMSNRTNSVKINNGSVVQLNHSCATNQYRSCTEVTLRMVRGIWEGRNKSLPVISCRNSNDLHAYIQHILIAYIHISNKHLNINTWRCILETVFLSSLFHYGDHISWWLLRAMDIRWSQSYCFYPAKELVSTSCRIIIISTC